MHNAKIFYPAKAVLDPDSVGGVIPRFDSFSSTLRSLPLGFLLG